MSQPTEILLVRHGESTWNEIGRYQGRIDTELSALGNRQAVATAQFLRAVPLDAIYASPLRRALVTAMYIANEQGKDVIIEESLTEIDHGRWNGLMRDEVEKQFGPLLELWQTEPSRAQMPGGESIGDVAQRALAGLERIVARHPGQRILIATHDAVLRVIVCHVLRLSLDQIWCIKTENASITTIEAEPGQGYRLVRMNDTCHLANLRSNMAGQAL